MCVKVKAMISFVMRRVAKKEASNGAGRKFMRGSGGCVRVA
jgi:hypothetical protein